MPQEHRVISSTLASSVGVRAVDVSPKSDRVRDAERNLVEHVFEYRRVGYDSRPMTFLRNGIIARGVAGLEVFWKIEQAGEDVLVVISSKKAITCCLKECPDGIWRGRWLVHEKMAVELRSLPEPESEGPVVQPGEVYSEAKILRSLFIVSLPRSLSKLIYGASRRALGLREPSWTVDGEILNQDRFVMQPRLSEDNGRKFTVQEREPAAFRGMLEFLDHVVLANGHAYKDVVQPFVVAGWIEKNHVPAIRVRRDIADVAYAMLNRRWHYPSQLYSNESNLEMAMVKGLVRAEAALDCIPAAQIEFDEALVEEKALRTALEAIYGSEAPIGDLRYVDDEFRSIRVQVLNRRKTARYQKLQEMVTAARGSLIAFPGPSRS